MNLPKNDPELADRLSGAEESKSLEPYRIKRDRLSYVRELEQALTAANRQCAAYRMRIRLALEYAPANANRTIAELKAALKEVK